MNIFISGSLAYDRIMDFPGHFADNILREMIHLLMFSSTLIPWSKNSGAQLETLPKPVGPGRKALYRGDLRPGLFQV